jgi:hypothetical protein
VRETPSPHGTRLRAQMLGLQGRDSGPPQPQRPALRLRQGNLRAVMAPELHNEEAEIQSG